ncbi:SRPBCC domain-containing protein [Mumia sp. zg.B53]|uniref:SRPBCC domain-containing protein n=1 Tax=Mumia sp. zg.B53 TaxID=2855449 RepID=UPI001C6F0EE0|nr:SRPBCC domain-containing protein [Mumia sp. zg.B53]MBW9214463.1 SRPBCC domain-containing protein [Mumia sp. zg.B53]
MTIAPTGRRESRNGTEYVVFHRRFAAPVEDVWAAVTEPERLERWIGTWTGDPATGEVTFTMTAEGPDTPEERYVVEECAPPRRLVVRFADPSEGSGPDWVLELDLDDSEGFTTLAFAQAMPDAETASSVGPGWDYYLDRLVVAERGDDPGELDYEQYAADQSEYYRSAFS